MYDIYSHSKDNLWRFTLGKSGRRPLLTIGLNPSTATSEKSDTTVAKVERVSKRQGFDGFIMLNLYPLRATDYTALPKRVNQEAFDANLAHIEAIVKVVADPVLWAAWGDPVECLPYFGDARDELLSRLVSYSARWVRYGAPTAKGNPRHPSRVSYTWSFAPYDRSV
jgi:hypothetical protein